MKKLWLQPKMENLSVKETAMSPNKQGVPDDSYIDDNGNYWNSYRS